MHATRFTPLRYFLNLKKSFEKKKTSKSTFVIEL